MPSFSQTSQQRLNTCHEKLQRIFNEVIKIMTVQSWLAIEHRQSRKNTIKREKAN